MPKRTLANQADKRHIVERLTRIQPSSERCWGTLSVNEMICHLADAFRMTIGEKTVGPLTEALLPIPLPPGFVRWVALNVPVRWPRGIKTVRELDPRRGGTKPSEFAADMRELRRLLERFTQRPRDFEWQPHPMFGAMIESDWMRWGYLHMDHHLRQFGA